MIVRDLWARFETWLADRWDPDTDDDILDLRAQTRSARAETLEIRQQRAAPHGNDFLEVLDTGRLKGDRP